MPIFFASQDAPDFKAPSGLDIALMIGSIKSHPALKYPLIVSHVLPKKAVTLSQFL